MTNSYTGRDAGIFQHGRNTALANPGRFASQHSPYPLGSEANRIWRDGWFEGVRNIRIRELNDALRTSFLGGRIMLTPAVRELEDLKRNALLAAVIRFDAWAEGNDPYGEHDFGAVELDGERYFFKIEYYNLAMDAGSDNPADPSITTRVLTVMHASEY